MSGYFISDKDLDLSRGCCSCPLTTGDHGQFCGRLIENDNVWEHVTHFTRPDNCPLHRIETTRGLVSLDTLLKGKEIITLHLLAGQTIDELSSVDDLDRTVTFTPEELLLRRIPGTYEGGKR